MGDPIPPSAALCDVADEPIDTTSAGMSQLYREHNRALVAYLTARLRSEQEAKEVAQESYVRLLEVKEHCSHDVLRAYLFKTATNLAIDRLRHRHVKHRSEEQPERYGAWQVSYGEMSDPAELLLAREQTHQLLCYLQELPTKCQHVVSLHRLDGIPQQEVAKTLGISARMVRRYVTYAMIYCHLRLDGMTVDQVRLRVSL